MKSPNISPAILLILVLGMALGAGGAFFYLSSLSSQSVPSKKPEPPTWPPRELSAPSGWIYLKVDTNGWSTGDAGSYQKLDERLAATNAAGREIVIPIFPTVYAPRMVDKLYYDAILESDIKPGDKVLVIGTGSGADAWVASLKSKAPVYAVEINPMSVANARTTARLGNFELKLIVGDVTAVKLPADFRDFDFVLWNMPFVWKREKASISKIKIEENTFYDGDDGTVLKKFLARLPSLLKKGGKAIVLNNTHAAEYIPPPGVMTKTNRDCALFVIPNP